MSKAAASKSRSVLDPGTFPRLWRWYCALSALEAAVAVLMLLLLPREAARLSLPRLAALAAMLAALLFFAAAAIRLPSPTTSLRTRLLALSAALALAAATALYLLRYLDPPALLPYFQGLSIPLAFALLVGIQALMVLSFPQWSERWAATRPPGDTLRSAGFIWLALVLLLALVALTGLGVTPDPAYWGEPGVPILGWQLALAILCGALALALAVRAPPSSRLDVLIAFGIWLVAVLAWLSVPLDVLQNSFYAPIRPPAYVPFPNSDAGYYDSMAHSLQIGYPYQGEIPSRPLYIAFLAGLHALFGQRYDLIIAAQTSVLALIPVLLYGIGSALHSRPAGVIAAAAAIGREWTSLAVSSSTRVSNSKMLLVDLPTLLAMLVCCWLLIRWFRRRDVVAAAIAGGSFAILLLLRTQTAVLLPIVVLFAAFGLRLHRRELVTQLAIFLVGVVLTLTPWLVHNLAATGQLTLDAPFQLRIIASQYRYTGNLDIQNVDLEGRSVFGILAAFLVRDPGFVLGFIINHALATHVGGLLALPLFHSWAGLLAPIEPYWANWDGSLSASNLILVTIYLAVIAVGLASAWRRHRWIGLLPLGLSLGYSLANGLARFSGWRYDLPADWVAYFYFAVGVAEILLLFAAQYGAKPPVPPGITPAPDARVQGARASHLAIILAAFTLVGALPWFAALLSEPRYEWASGSALVARLSESHAVAATGATSEKIEMAASQAGASLEVGRVLYPRFFSRDNGLASAHPWPAYAPRDFPRLGFLLLNEVRQDVLLPTRDIPEEIHHAQDAIILGCQRDGYIEARLILLPDLGTVIEGAPLSDPCG